MKKSRLLAYLCAALATALLITRQSAPDPAYHDTTGGAHSRPEKTTPPFTANKSDNSTGADAPTRSIAETPAPGAAQDDAPPRNLTGESTRPLPDPATRVAQTQPLRDTAGQTSIDRLADRISNLNTIAEVLAAVDMAVPAQRALAVARIAEIEDGRMEALLARAAAEGIPLELRKPDGRIARLHGFRPDGSPLYRLTTNTNTAISSAAAQLNATPYSLTGSGMKVAVWDEGSIRAAHQELTGRITLKNSSASLSDHATHVAGTIAAAGVRSAAKGMAPAATVDSYDWNNDYTEMSAAGAATASSSSSIALSNHSYGYDAATADMGRYETEARSLDAVAASLPYYLPFWASGNEQDLLTALGGYQSITFTSLAKNVLTVGAVNDAVSGGARAPSAGTISYFSSLGPCDDGRVKPDLVANGVGVYSSVSTGNTAYDTYDGTSMATPSAVGSAALVLQLYKSHFSGQLPRASLLKALLIHTADDLGTSGPDYTYGWGLINVKAAADVVLAHKDSLASPKLIDGSVTGSARTATHVFTWDGVSPIRATLAWTDPAGAAQTAADSRTPNLVHNLDLTVTAPDGTVYRPFVMPFVGAWTQASMALAATTGKNNVDNVEQVRIATPSLPGNYTVAVTVDGDLASAGQAYGLVVTGGSSVEANPAPAVALAAPASGSIMLLGSGLTLSASATDRTIGGGDGAVASVEFFADGASLGADTTAPYELAWTPSVSATYQLTAVATDTEGASAASAAVTLHVLSGDGSPAVTGFSPATAAEGATIAIAGRNFANVSSVTFNGAAAAHTVTSLDSLTATVPAGATSGAIVVTTAQGVATSASSFTVELSPVLISQIYGGGGQNGATLNSDYVELRNRGASAVSLAGWSVQYASASGTSWQSVALSGSIPAGGHYLVKLTGGSTGSALPTPDATGSINMSATNGKVALRNTATSFSGSSPTGQTGLQDFVGYGSAAAYEGSAAAPSPSTTTAIFRAGGGATDTGNNAADFSAAAPDPRNSAGTSAAPAITSATAAGGAVGSAFSYQIVATNSPSAYSAAPLPAGLSLNASTGRVSGTPTAAGTTTVSLGATNSAGTGTATLTITITASGGGATTDLLNEDFAPLTSGDNTTSNGSGTPWSGNANFPAVTRAYQAGGAVKIGTSSNTGSITSKALDLSGNGGAFTVAFKVKGWTTVEGNIVVSINGVAAQTVTYAATMSASAFETKTLQLTGGTASTTITFATSARRAYLDDITIGVAASTAPEITLSGTPAALTAIYGSPSTTPTSFTVAATNLAGPVTLAAPAGFELSQTAGGATGYAATQQLGSAGTLASTTLYARLAASVSAGTYSGDIAATSSGAQPRTLALPASEVRPRLLTVTALDRAKPFGQTLELGSTAYVADGLVGAETIGSVTLVASGGTAMHDAIGAYVIPPSAASGGTFTASNYDISYQTGALTVTGLDFAAWIAETHTGPSAEPAADPDADGLANLLEFYLGLEPDQPDFATAALALELADGELRYTYRRSKAQTRFSGWIEWTDTLSAETVWQSSGVTDEWVSDAGAYEVRRARVPMPPTTSRRFLRLHIQDTSN